MEEEMDIRPLEAEEAHPHREEKKRREREEKGEQGETIYKNTKISITKYTITNPHLMPYF